MERFGEHAYLMTLFSDFIDAHFEQGSEQDVIEECTLALAIDRELERCIWRAGEILRGDITHIQADAKQILAMLSYIAAARGNH